MATKIDVFDRWVGRGSGVYGLWPLIPAGAALMMGYLSSTVAWISQFGLFGWCGAAILTFFLVSVALAAIGHMREKWVSANVAKNWNLRTDTINPLKSAFEGQRISVSDLAHPITRSIEGKTLTNCELIGPANLVLLGGSSNNVTFMDVNIVVLKDGAQIATSNVVLLKDCHLIGGKVWNCTLFMQQNEFAHMKEGMPQANAITYEGPQNGK